MDPELQAIQEAVTEFMQEDGFSEEEITLAIANTHTLYELLRESNLFVLWDAIGFTGVCKDNRLAQDMYAWLTGAFEIDVRLNADRERAQNERTDSDHQDEPGRGAASAVPVRD